MLLSIFTSIQILAAFSLTQVMSFGRQFSVFKRNRLNGSVDKTALISAFQSKRRLTCVSECTRVEACKTAAFIQNDDSIAANCFLYNVTAISNQMVNDEITNLYVKKSNDLIRGVKNNISMSYFTDMGFSVVFDTFYSAGTRTSDLQTIRLGCTSNTMLCVGGKAVNSNILLTVACGKCLVVTSQTVLDTPVQDNDVYWYFTPTKSFGFAPNATITQLTADIYNQADVLRLSWHLDAYTGFRLGNMFEVYISDYSKIILKL